jgi:hypothetical protein
MSRKPLPLNRVERRIREIALEVGIDLDSDPTMTLERFALAVEARRGLRESQKICVAVMVRGLVPT